MTRSLSTKSKKLCVLGLHGPSYITRLRVLAASPLRHWNWIRLLFRIAQDEQADVRDAKRHGMGPNAKSWAPSRQPRAFLHISITVKFYKRFSRAAVIPLSDRHQPSPPSNSLALPSNTVGHCNALGELAPSAAAAALRAVSDRTVSAPSLRGAERRSNPAPRRPQDCFAQPVIGPATSGRTRWLAMTGQSDRNLL